MSPFPRCLNLWSKRCHPPSMTLSVLNWQRPWEMSCPRARALEGVEGPTFPRDSGALHAASAASSAPQRRTFRSVMPYTRTFGVAALDPRLEGAHKQHSQLFLRPTSHSG